ncbi:hypothetical protein [Nocardia sp. IFM 10818]
MTASHRPIEPEALDHAADTVQSYGHHETLVAVLLEIREELRRMNRTLR